MADLSPTIVLDAHIPHAEDIFSSLGRVTALPGHEIDAEAVRSADILIIRSITTIDRTLLQGSSVRFVGTATAGIDHLDTDFLSAAGIEWVNAPGANAESVVEYVLGAISVIASRGDMRWQRARLGVVGCGQVGERLARRAEALGMQVLRNDPPRAVLEGEEPFMGLQELLSQCDIVSVHVPLQRSGPYPTVGLLGADAIDAMQSGACLIQSSRGGTIDERAAVRARAEGRLGALVLDVFRGEPSPNPDAVAVADLATGHIAGYSRDAKRNGVLMIRDALRRFLGRQEEDSERGESLEGWLDRPQGVEIDDPAWLDAVLRQVIDLRSDDERFRKVIASENPAEGFHAYRADYPSRYSWSRYAIWQDATPEEKRLLEAMGFRSR